MRITSILQIILGIAMSYTSWLLADIKSGNIPSLGGDNVFYSPPPSAVIEFVTLFLSLTVIITGIIQKEMRIKFAGLQITFGVVIATISGFLGVRAVNMQFGEISGVYYLAYISLVLSIAIFGLGIVQFRRSY